MTGLPRRFLPPTPLLLAFEAAARLNSFTGAARLLNLTQSAVSRQIRQLEEQLEVELFVREKQTVTLTSAGRRYALEVREALRRIGTATLNLRANPGGGTLNLAILPSFAVRWLLPRLPGFLAASPEVTLNLSTRLSVFDFALEPFDAAIHFGLPDWPGARHQRLMGESVLPVCAPALRDAFGFAAPADLRRAPLLHLTSRPDAWERWLGHHGAPAGQVHGMLFDEFAPLAAAAAAGLGVALLPRFLFAGEFGRGELVAALELPLRGPEAYHLVWPADRGEMPALAAFRRWLASQALDSEAGAGSSGATSGSGAQP